MVTNSFSGSKTGDIFYINHLFNCNSKCIVYVITCRICKIHYVGQTTEGFRFRQNNYKACMRKAVRGEEHSQAYLHAQYLSEGHSGIETDGEITLIDKNDGASPLRREQFWMYQLKTLHPDGLNMEEGV